MDDLMMHLQELRRPRLLMRAARIGAEDYRRNVHLQRILGSHVPTRSETALTRLIELEDLLNDQRLSDDSAYNILRHIDVLIALVGEARILRSTHEAAA